MTEPAQAGVRDAAEARDGDTVYLLWHKRPLGEDETDDPAETNDKIIGVFSSPESAQAARTQVTSEPGFRDYPDDFQIGRLIVGETLFADGFVPDPPDP